MQHINPVHIEELMLVQTL